MVLGDWVAPFAALGSRFWVDAEASIGFRWQCAIQLLQIGVITTFPKRYRSTSWAINAFCKIPLYENIKENLRQLFTQIFL